MTQAMPIVEKLVESLLEACESQLSPMVFIHEHQLAWF